MYSHSFMKVLLFRRSLQSKEENALCGDVVWTSACDLPPALIQRGGLPSDSYGRPLLKIVDKFRFSAVLV
jgi:hypothetical protein